MYILFSGCSGGLRVARARGKAEKGAL